MSEKTILVCDACGRPAAETVTIKSTRGNFVKDLCSTHVSELVAGARKPRPGRRKGVVAGSGGGGGGGGGGGAANGRSGNGRRTGAKKSGRKKSGARKSGAKRGGARKPTLSKSGKRIGRPPKTPTA
jgi:hypothetical protein